MSVSICAAAEKHPFLAAAFFSVCAFFLKGYFAAWKTNGVAGAKSAVVFPAYGLPDAGSIILTGAPSEKSSPSKSTQMRNG